MLPGTAAVGASRNGRASPALQQLEQCHGRSDREAHRPRKGTQSVSGAADDGFLGEAREGSRYLHHGWNPAGYQGDILEFAEFHKTPVPSFFPGLSVVSLFRVVRLCVGNKRGRRCLALPAASVVGFPLPLPMDLCFIDPLSLSLAAQGQSAPRAALAPWAPCCQIPFAGISQHTVGLDDLRGLFPL